MKPISFDFSPFQRENFRFQSIPEGKVKRRPEQSAKGTGFMSSIKVDWSCFGAEERNNKGGTSGNALKSQRQQSHWIQRRSGFVKPHLVVLQLLGCANEMFRVCLDDHVAPIVLCQRRPRQWTVPPTVGRVLMVAP